MRIQKESPSGEGEDSCHSGSTRSDDRRLKQEVMVKSEMDGIEIFKNYLFIYLFSCGTWDLPYGAWI